MGEEQASAIITLASRRKPATVHASNLTETQLPDPWPPTTTPTGAHILVLDAEGGRDDPMADLSAAARSGTTLFLGSDEGACIERLLWTGERWEGHDRLALDRWLPIDDAEEADIEGLAVDDGWLWVIGSHARTRPKVAKDGKDRIDLTAFAELKDTRPRCLLARLPLALDPATGRMTPVEQIDGRRAAMLKQTGKGNALARAMHRDPLIGPFARIAAKEGGIDLEGLAVTGDRIAVGMRGPVIQGHAVLLEATAATGKRGGLKLARPLYKRLLALDGLGIRDLKVAGDDLLILAGPTTALDGPCAIYRWTDWRNDPAQDANVVRLHRPERIIDLPFGQGDDHPEGLLLLDNSDGGHDVVVIPDGPAAWRLAGRSLTCDLFHIG